MYMCYIYYSKMLPVFILYLIFISAFDIVDSLNGIPTILSKSSIFLTMDSSPFDASDSLQCFLVFLCNSVGAVDVAKVSTARNV